MEINIFIIYHIYFLIFLIVFFVFIFDYLLIQYRNLPSEMDKGARKTLYNLHMSRHSVITVAVFEIIDPPYFTWINKVVYPSLIN